MAYELKINSVDVSDYVFALGEVPIIECNKDYSLVASGFSFSLDMNCLTTPVKGQSVYFYRENELLFNGFVKTIDPKEEENYYNITVEHKLINLKNYYTNNAFKTLLEALDELKYINLFNHSVISMKNVFNAIFSAESLTLDWTLYSDLIIPWQGETQVLGSSTSIYGSGSGVTLNNVYIDQIYFLPNQLICINQEHVYEPSWLTSEQGEANRLSLFELLSILCTMLKITFAPKTETSFYVINGSSNYDIDENDDETYEFEAEEIDGDYFSGYSVSQMTLNVQSVMNNDSFWFPYTEGQSYYYDAATQWNGGNIPNAEAVVPTYTWGYGQKPHDLLWYNHFNPIILQTDVTYGHRAWIVYPYVNDTLGNTVMNQVRAISTNFIKKSIETDFDLITVNGYRSIAKIAVVDIIKDTILIEQLEEVV